MRRIGVTVLALSLTLGAHARGLRYLPGRRLSIELQSTAINFSRRLRYEHAKLDNNYLAILLVNFAKMLLFSSYDWFSRFFILSIELPKLAITSKRQLRYKKAKQDHGLQFDSWILQNCRHSRVMATSPWRPFWTFLRTKLLIVGSLGTSTLDMYCSSYGMRKLRKKKPISLRNAMHGRDYGHAHLTPLTSWSALYCILVSNLSCKLKAHFFTLYSCFYMQQFLI